jgi:hypothetical protein
LFLYLPVLMTETLFDVAKRVEPRPCERFDVVFSRAEESPYWLRPVKNPTEAEKPELRLAVNN